MSLDARYILVYESLYDEKHHPRHKDINFLLKKYGGNFVIIDSGNGVFWDKPKYTLLREELKYLCADQVLEKKDCELWEIIK